MKIGYPKIQWLTIMLHINNCHFMGLIMVNLHNPHFWVPFLSDAPISAFQQSRRLQGGEIHGKDPGRNCAWSAWRVTGWVCSREKYYHYYYYHGYYYYFYIYHIYIYIIYIHIHEGNGVNNFEKSQQQKFTWMVPHGMAICLH